MKEISKIYNRLEALKARASLSSLVHELESQGIVFPYPGVDLGWYKRLIATDKEYPGCSTPTDEIITKMNQEGVIVRPGTTPGNPDIFVRSAYFIDPNDTLFLHQLQITPDMDPRLKKLIEIDKKLNPFHKL